MSNLRDGVQASQATEGTRRFTFAQIPLVMRKDKPLNLADIAVTMFIMPWLDKEGRGWVPVKTIADGCRLGVSTVQESLSRLKAEGWIATVPSVRNRTGREFVAMWMTDEGFAMLCEKLGIGEDGEESPRLVFVVAQVVGPPDTSVGVQIPGYNEQGGNRGIQLKSLSVGDRSGDFSRRHRSPSGETTLAEMRGWGGRFDDDADYASLRRAIPELARATGDGSLKGKVLRGVIQRNARTAARLLFDEHSFRYHCGPLWEVAGGTLSPDLYLQAIEITLCDVAPKDVENLGAYFKRTLDNLRLRRTDAEFAEEYASQRGLATA